MHYQEFPLNNLSYYDLDIDVDMLDWNLICILYCIFLFVKTKIYKNKFEQKLKNISLFKIINEKDNYFPKYSIILNIPLSIFPIALRISCI